MIVDNPFPPFHHGRNEFVNPTLPEEVGDGLRRPPAFRRDFALGGDDRRWKGIRPSQKEMMEFFRIGRVIAQGDRQGATVEESDGVCYGSGERFFVENQTVKDEKECPFGRADQRLPSSAQMKSGGRIELLLDSPAGHLVGDGGLVEGGPALI